MAANYHIDANGNITKNGEAKKKKKKPSADYHIDINGNVTNLSDADIGPVEEKKSWFQSGEFEDGYQFGDLTKTILGSAGDLLEDAGAGILGMGEKAADFLLYAAPLVAEGQYYQNGGVYQPQEVQKLNQAYFDAGKKGNAEIIAKDLYNEEEIAKTIISKPIQKTTGFDIEKASVFGTKADSLAQSGGQLLGTAGLQMVGVPWWLTTGATSFGSEAENALNQGATYEEAGLSAAITAGAEILTEKLSGGISFGGKTLDDALTQQLATRISNKVVRNGLKIGMDFVGEGSEEVISSVFSNLGSALYKDESISELLTSEEAIDEYIDSFIGGGILGGVSSTGKAVKSETKGVDYVSGLTKNEKAVFDKVYNDAIAEQEADGKKLTQSEKSKLYDATMNALEKGYIDIDTIESVVGGDTYSSWKVTADQETKTQKEYDELYQMKNGEKSDAQVERQADLKKFLEDNATKKTQLREKLDGIVSEFVQGSRLSESYNEQARKEQKFEADLSQYTNESAKQTVKNFMEHTKSNNTNRAHDYLDFLTRISEDRGYVFDFTTTEQLQESIENGNPHGIDVDPERVEAFVSEKKKTIVINMSAKKSLNSLVGHEVVHTLEGFGEYDGLQEAVFKLAETRGEFADRLASIQRRYKGLSEDGQKKELTSDLLGDYLFTDYDFIKSLSTEKPNIFKRIYNEIKYLCKMATTGSRELRELERVKHQFEKIWRESSEENAHDDSDVKFSIRKDAPPKETGIAYKVFYVKDGKLYPPMVANPDGADTPMGVWLDADVGASAPPSKTGRQQVKAGGKGTQGGSGSLAFRPGWHLGDLPRASQFDRVNPDTGKKELFPENFVWAEVEYAKDVDYQEEAMSYGYTDNGKFRHAYAGLPRLPENGYYRYRTNPKPDTVPWIITGAMKVNRLLSDAEVNAILEKNGVAPVHRQGGDVGLDKFGFNEDGSVKYSISDSNGRQLSKGQQEYFKNSKARDDAGNLMVVYHGSQDHGFTVFDNGKSDDNMSFFFTNSEDMANSYVGDKSKLYEVYLNLENPYIVDAKGHRWNQIRLGENTDAITGKVERFVDLSMRYDVEIDFALVSESLGNVSDSVEYMLQNEMENLDDGEESLYSDAEKAELRQLASEIDEAYENWDEEAHLDEDGEPMSMSVYLLDHKLSTKYTTRQIAKIAKNQGHDGVIIENVYDNGKFTDVTHIHGFGNVYIAFDSNQIKNVDNMNPTSDADIRYSLSDSDGNQLTEGQQEFFKDSKARDRNGNLLRVYHTTDSDFTVFDKVRKGENTGVDNTYLGFFFSESEDYMKNFPEFRNGKTTAYYLDMKKPIDMTNVSKQEFLDVVELLGHDVTEAAEFYDSYFEEEIQRARRRGDDEPILILEGLLETLYDDYYDGAFYEALKPNYDKLVAKGYDGIINYMDELSGEKEYVVFDSNQAKLTTNENPTSDADVRYSLSEDSEGRELSEEQKEYFKGSKVVDENGKLLVVYHGTRNADFTVFNRNINFFTDSKEMADSYAPTGEKYTGYLNMKNPFVVDAKGDKWSGIAVDDEIVQMLRESGASVFKERGAWRTTPADIAYAIEEGIDEGIFDYDGVIIRNVDDTGSWHKGTDNVVANDYIIFNSNQFKNRDNTTPTSDKDIRFSLSETVEETKDLIAVHNLSGAKLMKSLKLGGLPMPSIAIAKAKDGHEGFGEISLVLSKDAIDPKANRSNKVYSGDAWTPTYPRVSYKLNEKVQEKIEKKIDNLVPYDLQNQLGGLHLDADNMSDTLDRNNGDMVNYYRNNNAMKYAFLVDTGKSLELPQREAQLSTRFDNALVVRVAERYGRDVIDNYNRGEHVDRETLISEIRDMANEYTMELYGGIEGLKETFKKVPKYTEDNFGFAQTDSILHAARRYFENGIPMQVDGYAARDVINENTNQEEYEKWLAELFSGVVEKTGIRNNRDLFTPSGNRRSWDALHYEETLENVIRAMKEDGEKGIGALGGNIFGASTVEFGSVKEIKEAGKNLRSMSHEEWVDSKKEFQERFTQLALSLPNDKNSYSAMDSAAETMVEAVIKYKTRDGIARYLKRELEGWAQYSEQTVDDLIELVNDIRNMPVNYFEAKPLRAVGFDEVGVFVIPNNADVKLKQELLNRGYSIAEYDPNVEGDRKRVVNQFEQFKFSLSDAGQSTPEYGTYNVYSKDITLQQDIAPVAEPVQAQPETVQDFGPLTEDQANERDTEQIEQSYFLDEDGIPEREEGYNGSYAEHVKPSDPFYEKDIWEVGRDRKVKAYMYENPEVKPFFQQEARYMLGELDNSVKGEKFYNDQLYYDTNGEMGFFGTTRHTSEDIAYLLDTFNYTYKQIAKGLRDIIEDNGKENNAVSKRIEFLLDERLRNGYTDFWFGDKIPPNQDYINLLNAKQITEYNDEAWNNWLRSLSDDDIQQYFTAPEQDTPPQEDIAPIKQTDELQQAWDDVDFTSDDMPLYESENGKLSMFEEPEAKRSVTRKELHENIVGNIRSEFAVNGYDLDDVLNGAKNLSTFATVDNTPQRVMEKALGYKEGQILSDLTVNQVAQNETEGIRWLRSFTDRKHGLLAQISKQYGIKPGSKESAAAQMYAEGFYVDEDNNIIAYGDRELAKDFPNRRVQANIKGLAKDGRIRQIYDETLRMINESRTRNAYPEIPRLENYFLHFRAMDDTFSRLGLPFNPNDIRAKDLPTDLNGVTADLKPGQPYFASAMHRTGKRTSFDLLGGLERYLTSAKNQIYHIDDIQTLRALRNYIADTYGQAHGLEGLDTLTEEEAQERIKEVYGSHLSTFAKFLNEEANILAGKTALIDRGLEGIIGRRGITFLDTVNRQVGSNMVGFNLSSSMTNFLPVVQTIAKSNKTDFIRAFAQTASNKIGSIFGRNDGFAEQSPVMIRRKGADRFYRTPFQKAGDAGYAIMGAVDSISTELIARTKYNELTRKGMDAQRAHYETDKWVSRLMGDRSLGQQPQLYNSKMLGLITKFQLEVRNQLDSQFYDTIQEAKASNEDIQNGLARNAKTAAKVASTFAQLAVVQHLFGKAFESVAGYNPAFDIIEVLLTAFGYDDDEESEDTVLDNIEEGFLALLEDLPYTGTLTGGRIPIASALPVEQFITGKDDYGNEKSRWETLKEVAPYYALPTGYGQIKKTYQGLSMFDDDLPIAGSYTDSGNLRFPVEDTLPNRVQAGVFGQWSSDVARDYFDNERNPLKEKQIEELVDLDMPIREYWDYREGLAKQQTLEDKFDYIADLDVSVEQKNIMINNVVDRKEPVDMSNYDDFADYEEFDFYTKNTEKYNFLEANGVSYSEYIADKERKEDYDNAYSWYKNNPEKVTVSKAVTDNVIEYRRYTSELNDIRADKDADGDSIAGSAKEKKLAYINGLDLDYGQRIILFRTYYDSKADKAAYNADIVDYLNSRDDISYEEMVTILEELDMKVHSDGTVTW